MHVCKESRSLWGLEKLGRRKVGDWVDSTFMFPVPVTAAKLPPHMHENLSRTLGTGPARAPNTSFSAYLWLTFFLFTAVEILTHNHRILIGPRLQDIRGQFTIPFHCLVPCLSFLVERLSAFISLTLSSPECSSNGRHSTFKKNCVYCLFYAGNENETADLWARYVAFVMRHCGFEIMIIMTVFKYMS